MAQVETAQEIIQEFKNLVKDDVRFKCSVFEKAPCPKIHTDNVQLRCIIAATGPGTVVVDRGELPDDDKLPDTAFFQTQTGDALLLRGRKNLNSPARHRSPQSTDRRVLLSLDAASDHL